MSEIRPLAEIRDEAIEVLHRYKSTEGEARTDVLRAVARLFVEARQQFYAADGQIDWRGRTWGYRQFVSQVFSAVNLGENVASIQSGIRYHVSNTLRERLDTATLEAIGLRKESARYRSVLKREKQASMLALVGPGPALTAADEITEALTTVSTVFSRVPLTAVRALGEEDRKRVFEAAQRIRDAVEAIVGASAG